ncbi:DUF4384 domain-containing protein [Crenothrix sp.]|uniref:DUF4384 domain-containing protein n=1 Tax=Crenothrix sp. TaxID=3100433 RepID=UPI00374D6BD4
MKTIIKRCNNLNSAFFLAIFGTLIHPTFALAEAGAKSMFASEGTSVMMGDDVEVTPSTRPAAFRPKATVISKQISPVRHVYAHAGKSTVTHVSKHNSYANNDNAQAETLPVSYAGLQYWIDLQDASGRSQRVTTKHTFRSGDRIKLQIKSKTDGYLYVLNEDASGRKTPLYPTKGQPSGLIQANATYSIPTQGTIRFDNVPGNEKVTIALSKFPMPSSGSGSDNSAQGTPVAYNGQSMYVACNDSNAGSKGMFAEDSSTGIDCMRSNYSAGSKGMFAEEDSGSLEPASYTVLPAAALDTGNMMFIDFNLTHR